MPRISDPDKYKKTGVDKEIKRLEREIEQDKAKKAKESDEKDNPTLKKKKEPKWALWYVIIAILVFGLGLLIICTINFFVSGTFGF